MVNNEREIAGAILSAGHKRAAEFGLRFDRVVARALGELRAFAEATAPGDVTLVVTLSAPIREPARTVSALKQEIGRLISETPLDDTRATVHGNAVGMRVIMHAPNRAPRLIGFVHNASSPSEPLLELAERWLRAQT
jgi:hypothetical protein